MIDINELKPVLEPLLEGREDSADIIEKVSGLDREVAVDRSEIDALNKSWNDRFMAAFFGEKGKDMSAEIPTVTEETEETAEEEVPGENGTYDELFTAVEEKKEED